METALDAAISSVSGTGRSIRRISKIDQVAGLFVLGCCTGRYSGDVFLRGNATHDVRGI